MDIYVGDAVRKVYLSVPVTPVAGTMNVTINKNGEEVHEVATVLAELDGTFSITVPFSLIQEESELEVVWSFQYIEDALAYEYTQTTAVSVVTPCLPLNEISAIIGDNSDFTAPEIERIVRYAINAYTGQRFGKRHDLKRVRGTGQKSLLLPERLISIKSIEQYGFGYKVYDIDEPYGEGFKGKDLFFIDGDGWYLKTALRHADGIKADDGGHWNVTGPIYNPFSGARNVFSQSQTLLIDGVWGWNAVPDPVLEAARILVNDYACNESLYRDRYIQQTATSDWRLVFNSGAYAGTGNVKADQLLANYTLKRGWAVL